MSDIVPTSEIEGIVGVNRHPTDHIGRAVSAEQTVYVLHPASCLAAGMDLRECKYSIALDDGIDMGDWTGREDQPVQLAIDSYGYLVPDGVSRR
jgi:hypothetical protein